MAVVVLYDACVLHPAPLRDLLVWIARTGLVRARWSDPILDECFASIVRQRPGIDPAALHRTRELLGIALRDARVTGYERLVDGLDLPDPNDRHVLAAAIRANAQAIVTFNLKDFPGDRLARYDMEAKHPDEFVLDSIDLAPGGCSVPSLNRSRISGVPRSRSSRCCNPACAGDGPLRGSLS